MDWLAILPDIVLTRHVIIQNKESRIDPLSIEKNITTPAFGPFFLSLVKSDKIQSKETERI